MKKYIVKLEDATLRAKYETGTPEELDAKPKLEHHTMLNTMPTTEKVTTQVQCQVCGKSMSALNFKYSHAA